MKILSYAGVISACLSAMSTIGISAEEISRDDQVKIVLSSEIKWEKLNPARGDNSPQAGTLWGDRNAAVPTGFLAKFVDEFSSPPHIHNATYRAVVIEGLIHNDDPDAAEMWMPSGSFWTQPKGESHITSAKGEKNIALVEIDEGPYFVLPPEKAFDSGERPINVDPSNIVWTVPVGLKNSQSGPKIAYLWGDLKEGNSNGTFIKLPREFAGKLKSQGTVFRVVIIKGLIHYEGRNLKRLDPGSYLSSVGPTIHNISSTSKEESILYIRTNGPYKILEKNSGLQ